MNYFEDKSLRTAKSLPGFRKRYAADTYVIQYKEHKEQFLHHINNIGSAIKFTVEKTREIDCIPLLKILEHHNIMEFSPLEFMGNAPTFIGTAITT